jgi:hypothetical protein
MTNVNAKIDQVRSIEREISQSTDTPRDVSFLSRDGDRSWISRNDACADFAQAVTQ